MSRNAWILDLIVECGRAPDIQQARRLIRGRKVQIEKGGEDTLMLDPSKLIEIKDGSTMILKVAPDTVHPLDPDFKP